MSTEYANLGFIVNSGGLVTAEQRLRSLTLAGMSNESQNNAVAKSIGGVAAALLSLGVMAKVRGDIFSFDQAMKGLQATTRVGTKAMKDFEDQARSLGAISKFSATEAAQAQRFLAMAGFDTNEILSATPSILKLATAGELSLAQAADMASNALGGMQLPVEELDRVIDVMAETAASANTNITQMADALSYAAPLAVSAGISVEEAAAAIGKLSDNGLQGSRAGTGLLGVIRQLSKPSSEAAKTLNNYGLTLADVNIKSRGLANVLKKVNDAGLDTAAMFTVFGSEAAPAAGILASANEELAGLTEKLGNAAGAADAMSGIMAGSLTAGLLGVGSALSEVALQAGDAGLAGGMKEAMLATTGFIHVFTGMLPEFAEANNLTAEYVSQLNDVADTATIAAGALGGMLALMVTTKVAILGAAGAMSVLNAVILANPFALAVTAIAAVAGALYAARNMTVDFGGETVKVSDIVGGAFNAISDGFDVVADSAVAAYDMVSQFFFGTSENAETAANDVANNMGGSFVNIYNQAKQIVNGVIATFVTLGKSIGVIAASITMAFANSFDNVKSLGVAFSKDLSAILDGDFSASNLSSTIERTFSNPLKMTFSELGKIAADSFGTDYIGEASKKLTDIVYEAKTGLELYTLAVKKTREENEALAESSKQLGNDVDWMLGKLGGGSSVMGESSMSSPFELGGVDGELDTLIEKVDQFGGAWTNTGNVIAESMGGAVSVLEDFASKMQSITDLQSDLTKEREKYADGSKEAMKIDKSLAKLNAETGKAQIGAIGKTIGLSAQLFKENSKERKALHALEMGFMAVEIAMAAEKAIVNAVNAVASQGQGDPFTAFGRIAAMVGIMGGVLAAAGIAFGGGSGGGYEAPAAGGTGTVLGDSSAQSESISNVMEIYEEIQIDQLYELQKIRQSMSQLSSGISQLTQSFATNLNFTDSGVNLQNSNFLDTGLGSTLRKIDPVARVADWIDSITGDFLGLGGIVDKIFGGFSSKKQKLIDSGISFFSQTMQDIFEGGELDANMYQVIETTKKKFWGLSKSSSTSAKESGLGGAITAQMGDIFGFIGETVIAATASLGLEAVHIIHTGLGALGLEEALKGFVIDIGDVSFLDKTGDEIQEELEAIFSQQADLMATYLVPSIADYQKVGEGAFETLQRVAYEQAVFNDALDRTGMSLSGLSKLMQIDVAQAVIDLTGGLDSFTELSNSFFESFYTEAEQLSYLESSLSDVFSSLGLSLVDSREQFKDLLNGADLTTEAGRELYAMLLQLVPSMDDYLSSLEKEEEKRKQLRISFLEDEKSLINSAINGLSSLVNSINSELGNAYSIQEALTAARMGDFELAKKMARQRVKSSDFGDAVSFARAQAIERNRLFELGMLADAEKSDLERQVELLDKQIEAIENGTSEQVSAIIDLGVIMEGGNLEIIKAIMGSGNTKTNSGLMNDIPSGSSPINKSLEESKQQSANAMQQAEMMNREIVKNTKTTAKILQRMEFNQEQLQ